MNMSDQQLLIFDPPAPVAKNGEERGLKPGYKETEIGILPEEWEVVSLEELGSWKGGATPSMSNPSYWLDGTIYWASSSDIKNIHITETGNLITDAAVKKSSTTLLQKGAILIVTRSGILKRYLPIAKNNIPVAINQDIKALIPNSRIIADYCLQVLLAHGPNILSTCMKAGTTVESIEYTWLKRYRIPLPPLHEQHAIAAALSDVDALINSLDKLIAKKHDIKQGAMQELLIGKRRLSGLSGEWGTRQLGEIGAIYGGLSGKSGADFGCGQSQYIPFVNVMNNSIVDVNDFGYVNVSDREAQNRAIAGDLFFNASSETPNEVGMCSVLLQDIPKLYLNSFCFGYRFNKNVVANGLYFVYFFRSSYGRKFLYTLAQGSTRYNLSKGEFLMLQIPFPSIQEQHAIAEAIFDMDAEITALERKRDKTRALKQAMMQELLTGKTRLV